MYECVNDVLGSLPTKRLRMTDANASLHALGAMGVVDVHTSGGSDALWFHRSGPSVAPERPPSAVEVVKNTRLDLSKLSQEDHTKTVSMPESIARHVMTAENRRVLVEVSGSSAEWHRGDRKVVLRGTSEQVSVGAKLLVRVATHCQWGCNEEKVRRLINPRQMENVRVRLAPMGIGLQFVEKALSSRSKTLSIGKHKSNDVSIIDTVVSRNHCVLELDTKRGAVYVVDHSTNGTFLNGKRLPQKKHGKVVLSHGDELLLKGANRDPEFGYMVNLVDVDEGVDLRHARGGPSVESALQGRHSFGSAF
eukprot:TRINITY_DN44182_c0_g1_i1.p1 TRINITY_DN44182_c0_g1~~TRINITY_DN44182_c0_g1_i1.p1  ORF type:complete len:307 (+),score=50.80 TRINITY_DN44182_c0_g1_i1:155-1075(+)